MKEAPLPRSHPHIVVHPGSSVSLFPTGNYPDDSIVLSFSLPFVINLLGKSISGHYQFQDKVIRVG